MIPSQARPILLRSASSADTPELARILDGARREVPLKDSFTLERIVFWLSQLRSSEHRVFVTVEGIKITAMLVLKENDAEAEVAYLVTAPGHQRQGHARYLLRHAKTAVHDAEIVAAKVQSTNVPVIALLASEGFVADALLNEKYGSLHVGWSWYAWRAPRV